MLGGTWPDADGVGRRVFRENDRIGGFVGHPGRVELLLSKKGFLVGGFSPIDEIQNWQLFRHLVKLSFFGENAKAYLWPGDDFRFSTVILERLHLSHYRNIVQAQLPIASRRTFLLGPNGQGKTNLLEAIGYASVMRSFRTADYHHLIARDSEEAGLWYSFRGEDRGESTLEIRLRAKGREIRLDGQRLARLGEVVGHFPTVTISSQDIQLLRGGPGGRRRWLDMALTNFDPAYLPDLRSYQEALQARNSLLRNGEKRDSLYGPFEKLIAQYGTRLIAWRDSYLRELERLLKKNYGILTTSVETAGLIYQSGWREIQEDLIRERLASRRDRDRVRGFTQEGPHRDDWTLQLEGFPAVSFGSEGQQRGLVLGLALAQRSHLENVRRVRPILLADDILGELDPGRRERFWDLLPEESQILASGTEIPELPDATGWAVWKVDQGSFIL